MGLYALDISSASPVQMNVIGTESILLTMPKGHRFEFHIIVRAGSTITNQKVYPMLRLATDENDTFAPYAMTNRELTEKIQTPASSNNLGGVKVGNNLTVGNDGTLTVNNLTCDFGETPIIIDCESSEEQEVGTWLNRKLYMSAIYCAGVTFNKENDEVQVVSSHGISNISEIIFASFTVKVANNNWSPLPRKDLYLDIDKTDIHGYTTSSTKQQKEVRGLVYYTKTS